MIFLQKNYYNLDLFTQINNLIFYLYYLLKNLFNKQFNFQKYL